MYIQKLINDTNPMVTLVFRDTKECKDYIKGITDINKRIIAEPTIVISEETLLDIVTLFKKTAKKKKDTGEVYITLSGSQLVSILPLYFGMIFLHTPETNMEKEKTIPRSTKGSRQKKGLQDDMIRLCAM